MNKKIEVGTYTRRELINLVEGKIELTQFDKDSRIKRMNNSSPTWHGPLINMQKSVFLPLWDNHELYGRKLLHIENFSAKESEN